MALVATSTPKRHGFSIESLIGRRDDSPRRQSRGLLPRPEDFSSTRDLTCSRDFSSTRDLTCSRDFSSTRDLTCSRDFSTSDGSSSRERSRDSLGDQTRAVPSVRDNVKDSNKDSYCRDTSRSSPMDTSKETVRDNFRDLSRESFRTSGSRSRSRPGTVTPTSNPDEDRTSSPSSPAAVLSPRVEKTLSSSSPEAENRLAGWSSEDFKHLLGTGAFHHQGHHALGVDGSGLYQPLRVCNRSLSAAMSSAAALMPHQFAGLPVNPLLYNLHRELTAPHHAAHPLLAARYPGFVHPRYPLGPPPGLLFHPYRKPKRNRTAFSPSQLLQLEQAFEKNHYVVGQERKTLASKLQLTETQVKVWFQNRRTKHKRMKAEEEATGGATKGDDAGKTGDNCEGHTIDSKSDASDHELLEEDMCTSDEELSVTEDS